MDHNTNRPGDLPAAGTPRWGAPITCVSTQSHSPRPQVPVAPLQCCWGEFSTCETPKCSHTPTHAAPRWLWHPHRETPQPRACTPLFTTSFPLHHTRHKNQTGKISQDRESTPPAGFSLCLYTPSCHWDSELPGTKVKSHLLLQSQCCISHCHEHKPFAHCLQIPESCTVFFLLSKYKIIIKE